MKFSKALLTYIIFSMTFLGFFNFLTIIPSTVAQEDNGSLDPAYDIDTIFLTSGDLIKNFKFDKFCGSSISNNKAFGNKVGFETQGLWTLTKDDVDLLYHLESGDIQYYYYKVSMRKDINVFTNLNFMECSERFTDTTEKWECIDFKWKGLDDKQRDGFRADISWTHLSLGDVYKHNLQNNYWSGDLEMSFDIDDTVIPDVITDELGFELEKEFAYIGVSSVVLEDETHGKLNTINPEVKGISNVESKSQTLSQNGQPDHALQDKSGASLQVSVNPYLTGAYVHRTVDLGINVNSKGSDLNPEDKNGDPIFDSKTEEKSMDNCSFSTNFFKFSPVVFEYRDNFHFTHWKVRKYDKYFTSVPDWDRDSESKTKNEKVAIWVHNRFVQLRVKLTLNVWTAYKIEVVETDEVVPLEKPEEYYDNVTFGSIVSGTTGASFESQRKGLFEDIFSGLFGDTFGDGFGDFFAIGIIIIIAIIIVVVLAKFIGRFTGGGKKGKVKIQVQQPGYQPVYQTFQQPGFTQQPYQPYPQQPYISQKDLAKQQEKIQKEKQELTKQQEKFAKQQEKSRRKKQKRVF